MSTQAIPRLTPEEYLAIERRAEHKSEYINGRMYAMAGASPNHNRIATSTLASLYPQLRGTSCEVNPSDFRIVIPAFKIYTYADVSVICGSLQLTDEHQDTFMNPRVIVEVLSDSTEKYDRGEKFRYYRSIPSFTEYLLLAQDEMRAEHFVRQPDDAWIFREFTSPKDEIELASIGCRLNLGLLYERVEFAAQDLPRDH